MSIPGVGGCPTFRQHRSKLRLKNAVHNEVGDQCVIGAVVRRVARGHRCRVSARPGTTGVVSERRDHAPRRCRTSFWFWSWWPQLLAGHGDAEAFVGVDEVVVVVVAEVELDPVDLSGEPAAAGAVVGGDSGAGFVADVGRLIS